MLPATLTTSPCQHCLPFKRQGFSSEQDFITFQDTLDEECRNGLFIRIVETNTTNEVESFYQCTFCNKEWELSTPNYSWRGYFLPKKSNALKREGNSSFKTFQWKGKNGCGCCLGMIFLIVLLILYVLYSFFDFLLDALF